MESNFSKIIGLSLKFGLETFFSIKFSVSAMFISLRIWAFCLLLIFFGLKNIPSYNLYVMPFSKMFVTLSTVFPIGNMC